MCSPRWLIVGSVLPILAGAMALPAVYADDVPPGLQKWLVPQDWVRDVAGPIVSLGETGDFDDTHLFAPAVTLENEIYRLYYSGASGSVATRVMALGLAESRDGRKFVKVKNNPVYRFGDGRQSVLTACPLRSPTGATLRENGKLRMWFSSTDFQDPGGLHTLHETSSSDGLTWSKPSGPLLKDLYAPTIIKSGNTYEMWYTDVAPKVWVMRHAASEDGSNWNVTADPVLTVDQEWEISRLFYPCVLKIDGVYLMWYGAYWSARPNTTALGFAVSEDGVRWHKHPQNPVFRPDATRAWESHYVTSQSVMQFPDGSFRIWYASRKQPPFVNKYFAIGTARWDGLKSSD